MAEFGGCRQSDPSPLNWLLWAKPLHHTRIPHLPQLVLRPDPFPGGAVYLFPLPRSETLKARVRFQRSRAAATAFGIAALQALPTLEYLLYQPAVWSHPSIDASQRLRSRLAQNRETLTRSGRAGDRLCAGCFAIVFVLSLTRATTSISSRCSQCRSEHAPAAFAILLLMWELGQSRGSPRRRRHCELRRMGRQRRRSRRWRSGRPRASQAGFAESVR